MGQPRTSPYAAAFVQRPWDAQVARKLITPLKDTWVTPNYLTTVRLFVGLAAAAAFLPGTYGWSNLAARGGAQGSRRARAAMTKWGTALLTAGALLFIGVLASQGLPAVLSALAVAGWGVQEGGYLLLAPLVGLSPDTALALSLSKRAREILLGLPGLLYLHASERSGAAATRPVPP